MGGIRVIRLQCAALCAAALLAFAPAAVAQTPAPATPPKDAAAQKKTATPKPSATQAVPTLPSPATGMTESRHIGKIHQRLRKHAHHVARHKNTNPEDPYVLFTEKLESEYHLKVLLAPTIMTQWGSPDGGPNATQVVVSPQIHWDAFKSAIGDGSVDFAYTSNRYVQLGQNAASLTSRLNALTPINDTPLSTRQFNQLTYSHDFPGDMLIIGVGQFTLTNYDLNAYAGSQQLNFINYSLSQNASQTYPTASLGAFVHMTPIKDTLDFVVGFQDANNISGNNIQTSTVGDGPYTTFAYAQWKPKFGGLDGAYSILYYHQPAVELQPAASEGWSLNATQDLNAHWGLFLRANTTTGPISPIKNSVAAGFVYKLDREHPNNQIGVGIARNATNMDAFVGQDVRASEWVVEVYWNTVVWDHWVIGPDVQIYINPALNPNQGSAQVYSLRLTGLF